jgi:hypothetical protein
MSAAPQFMLASMHSQSNTLDPTPTSGSGGSSTEGVGAAATSTASAAASTGAGSGAISGEGEESGVSEGIISRLRSRWPHIKTYTVYLGVGVGVLFVIKIGLAVVDFFATLNFLDVGEVSFIAGLICGAGAAGCALLGTRVLRLRPEAVFKLALQRISTDPTCINYMGAPITTGSFRAYSYLGGHPRFSLVPGVSKTQHAAHTRAVGSGFAWWDRVWVPKRLQLFFQITGGRGVVGMASAEVERNWRGDHRFTLLSIDVEGSGDRIVLEGDTDYRIYKGIIKLR